MENVRRKKRRDLPSVDCVEANEFKLVSVLKTAYSFPFVHYLRNSHELFTHMMCSNSTRSHRWQI